MLLINKYDFFFGYSKVLHVVCVYMSLVVNSYDLLSVSNRLLSHFSHFHRRDDIGNLEKINHIKKQYNIVCVCL